MLQKIKDTADWIRCHTQSRPLTAIILGTGLGRLASEIDIIDAFAYQDIPNFPVSTVEGHSGKLIFGRLGGTLLGLGGFFLEDGRAYGLGTAPFLHVEYAVVVGIEASAQEHDAVHKDALAGSRLGGYVAIHTLHALG